MCRRWISAPVRPPRWGDERRSGHAPARSGRVSVLSIPRLRRCAGAVADTAHGLVLTSISTITLRHAGPERGLSLRKFSSVRLRSASAPLGRILSNNPCPFVEQSNGVLIKNELRYLADMKYMQEQSNDAHKRRQGACSSMAIQSPPLGLSFRAKLEAARLLATPLPFRVQSARPAGLSICQSYTPTDAGRRRRGQALT